MTRRGSGPERKSERASERPWSVPLAASDVPDGGRHLELLAGEGVRAAIARLAGLAALPRLEAAFDVTPRGRGGLHVVGRVSATVGQLCVVTLEPIENEVEEPIDVVLAPDAAPSRDDREIEVTDEDAPEALVGGTVDLGAIATEFLLLGIDPYPRRPGAVFQAAAGGDAAADPFAALAALKKKRSGRDV
jgi:Large ribosomal RNA subunit accumulation protein YceD